MTSKFQQGDRVEILESEDVEDYEGEAGVIVKINSGAYPYKVEFEDGESEDFTEDEMKLIESVKSVRKTGIARKKINMNKLTILAKSIVDADLRNMIKVGWIDNSLQLTEEGEQAILAHYLSANKAELGKLAEAELKDRRKDKKGDE